MISRFFCKEQQKRSDLEHDVRNALAGIQLERKKMFLAVKTMFTAILQQEKHMKRIEEALARGRTDSEDQTP